MNHAKKIPAQLIAGNVGNILRELMKLIALNQLTRFTGSLKDSVRLRGNSGKLQEIQSVFYQQRTL